MEETKIIYYLEEQDTPYLVKLNISPDKVTLKDFKNALNRQNFKYFFKSMDDDFGVVKEEVLDEDAHLPCFNGRVIAWLISTEGSIASDSKSQISLNNSETHNNNNSTSQSNINTPIIINSNLNGGGGHTHYLTNNSENNIENGRTAVHSIDNHHNIQQQEFRKPNRFRDLNDDTTTETESLVSTLRDLRLHRSSSRRHYNSFNHHLQNQNRRSLKLPPTQKKVTPYHAYDASSIMSSELDTTTFFDSENDDQFSSVTESTTMSSRRYGLHRKKKLKHKIPSNEMDRVSSVSSLTESTMSLNIITVTLNMDTVNFLGISIVGQSNKGGDGGIYVGSIMNGGAVALDGRIEPGDMILQVNDISFENMSNDDAVKVLREAVMKPGPIKLVVAKCWDPNPKGYFTVSKQEPIRPIDPSAWVAHTAAMTAGTFNNNNNVNKGNNNNYYLNDHHYRPRGYPPPANSISTFGSNSSLSNSIPDTDTRYGNDQLNLTVNTDMETVVRAMCALDSGLDIRDRNWLKITISNAFIGSDVVDWLFNHVEGFPDRRDARKYACALLKHGYIRHAVNKIRFSEQCYYIFGEFNGQHGCGANLFTLNEESEDFDSVSELDRDTMGHQMKSMPPPPSYISSSNTSGTTSTTTNSQTTSGIASQTEKNYNLYYPPINSIISGTSSFIDNNNHTYITSGINSNYTSALSITQQTQTNYTVNTATSNNSATKGGASCQTIKQNFIGGSGSRTENKSIKSKSSDNSSSGNGSDVELLSKNRFNNKNEYSAASLKSYYKLSQIQQQQQQAKYVQQQQINGFSQQQQQQQPHQQQRSLDKVPADLRSSKQSFRMAMGNPCEFFIDVM